MDTWSLLKSEEARQALRAIDVEREKRLHWKPFNDIKALMPELPDMGEVTCNFDQAFVQVGEDLSEDDPRRAQIEAAARACMPWKKGPFKLFGIEIDAEWRSDYKWDRLKKALPDQKDKVILDVGGNNGYYGFRMLSQEPKLVVNIDPIPRLHYQWHLLQHFAKIPNFNFHMWGWEEVAYFEEVFDTVFSMGTLYHHSNPVQLLKDHHKALKPGGLLVLESIVIDGDGDHCLFPEDRYAAMRNVWFVPTAKAMCNMLMRTKFKDIQVIATNRHEVSEQRTTSWNPGHSYENFIDPEDPNRTIEGHPAPHRAIVFARK